MVKYNDGTMHFFDHLRELRRRLMVSVASALVSAIIAYILYHQYTPFLIEPFGEDTLINTELQQGFTLRVKVAIYVGLIMSLPIHIYNILAFIFPALTDQERRYLRTFFCFGAVLVFGGLYMAYFQVLPLAVTFLKDDAFFPDGVTTLLTYEKCLMFVFQLLLAFAVLFQIPLVLLLLMALGLVSRARLLSLSRYFIVLMFVISAIFTPPDFVSQIGLALPLILLFYIAILVAKVMKFGESSGE